MAFAAIVTVLMCGLLRAAIGETIELKCNEIVALTYYERYFGTKCTISNVTADSSASFVIRTSNSFEYNKIIQEVEFTGSQLYDLPREVFSTFQFLKKLQTNRAGIEEISKYNFNYAAHLLELRMRSNRLRKLPNSVFSNAPLLETIDLSSNEIAEVEPNAFVGMASLQYLTLSDNSIVKLDENVFRDLTNLVSIRLDSNKLQVLEAALFARTASLSEIRIDSNEIATIAGADAFTRLPKLKLLNLGNNRLRHIDIADTSVEKLWIAQNNIKELKLNKNLKLLYAPVNEITSVDFHGNVELLEVKLRQNFIADFTNFSASLAKVEVLDMSYNPLTALNVASFARMPELVRLNLEFTNISAESLTFGTFAHNANLSQLDLSYNQLGRIDFNIFTSLAQLSLLNVDGNNLTQIPYEQMKQLFPKLSMISISDNDWNCTYLAAMIKQLRQNNMIVRVMARSRVFNETNVDGIRCVANNRQTHVEWSEPVVHEDDVDDEFPYLADKPQRGFAPSRAGGLNELWSRVSLLELKIMTILEKLHDPREPSEPQQQKQVESRESAIVQSEVSFIRVLLCLMCFMMLAFMLLTIAKSVKTYLSEQRDYFSSKSFSLRRSTATINTTVEDAM